MIFFWCLFVLRVDIVVKNESIVKYEIVFLKLVVLVF